MKKKHKRIVQPTIASVNVARSLHATHRALNTLEVAKVMVDAMLVIAKASHSSSVLSNLAQHVVVQIEDAHNEVDGVREDIDALSNWQPPPAGR